MRGLREAMLALALAAAAGGCDSPGGGGGGATSDAVSGDAVSGDTTTGADTFVAPGETPIRDPRCTDGTWSEALPVVAADITSALSGYSAAAYDGFVTSTLASRYPTGAFLVTHAVTEYTRTNCVTAFAQGATGSAETMAQRLSTIVHECGHLLDGARGGFGVNTYVIDEATILTCRKGDTTARGGNTLPRSAITADAYDALLPDDFYKQTYLVDPGSEQGFNMLMEEAVQYVNSLATDYAFEDQIPRFASITARDGILTFLWYMERYLHLTRLEAPEVYAFITGDACWRELVLTVWGRAWMFLDLTADTPSLGIDDDVLEDLVLAPELLDEIARVRAADACF